MEEDVTREVAGHGVELISPQASGAIQQRHIHKAINTCRVQAIQNVTSVGNVLDPALSSNNVQNIFV